MTKQPYLRLFLGKFRVVSISDRLGQRSAKVQLGGTTTMEISSIPLFADLRPGDLLTFYTEVPYAAPKSTPIE